MSEHEKYERSVTLTIAVSVGGSYDIIDWDINKEDFIHEFELWHGGPFDVMKFPQLEPGVYRATVTLSRSELDEDVWEWSDINKAISLNEIKLRLGGEAANNKEATATRAMARLEDATGRLRKAVADVQECQRRYFIEVSDVGLEEK